MKELLPDVENSPKSLIHRYLKFIANFHSSDTLINMVDWTLRVARHITAEGRQTKCKSQRISQSAHGSVVNFFALM